MNKHKDPEYLAWLKTQACVRCGARPDDVVYLGTYVRVIEAHHCRVGSSRKDDRKAISLCGPHGIEGTCHHYHENFHNFKTRQQEEAWVKQQREEYLCSN